jgi:DNA mismatch repair protein MutL
MIDVSPLPGIEQAVFEPREEIVSQSEGVIDPGDVASFELRERIAAPSPGRLGFEGVGMAGGYGDAAAGVESGVAEAIEERPTLNSLGSLSPLGQLRDSFILAVNEEGLWIIDQHVAHERVLFEKILREREVEKVQRQRLLMPVLVDLLPEQMVTFSEIGEELERNGFEAEPFGPRTLAIKAAPVGLEGRELERMLEEVLGVTEKSAQVENEDLRRTRIAASIACHAAIKVNMPLEPAKIDWLLRELAKTEHPTSCPHGRPIALRYSLKEIQRAFQRI